MFLNYLFIYKNVVLISADNMWPKAKTSDQKWRIALLKIK